MQFRVEDIRFTQKLDQLLFQECVCIDETMLLEIDVNYFVY